MEGQQKVVIIVQARMASYRFPGKSMKEVLGRPLLSFLLERIKRVALADAIIVATTKERSDQPIVEICHKEGVSVFRGSDSDVLERYYQAAQMMGAEAVVRVTGDCPLIDPHVVDQVIRFFLGGSYDYASNTLERTFPRGMDVEVFSYHALEQAAHEATEPMEREHVTPFFYHRPERFALGKVVRETDESSYRLTVDMPEDLTLIKKVMQALYPGNKHFGLTDILQLLKAHPDWKEINARVVQKGVMHD